MSKYKGFKAKCRGYSHEQSGIDCQDSVEYSCDDEVAVCVVSDGHGSEKYFRSHVGSEMAVEIAVVAVKKFVARQINYRNDDTSIDSDAQLLSIENHSKLLNNLAGYIVSQWNDKLENHWDTNPCDEKEKLIYSKYFTDSNIKTDYIKIYGATLIIGVITDYFGFIIQIGDGVACIIKQNGHKLVPSEIIDENQFGGRTNSLSSSNCLSLFRFYFIPNIPKAIIVASDGVVDSYGGNDGKDYLNFCSKLVELYSGNYEQAQKFLDYWLPQLSEKGSQDDMSIAGVFVTPKTDIIIKNETIEVSDIVNTEKS